MPPETLRRIIEDKRRSSCSSEPNAHAIANHLSAMYRNIFDENNPNKQSEY
jgi:hypothetical protein